jgi:hypothetical protein
MRIVTCVSYPEDQLEGPQLGRRMNQGGSVFVGKLGRAVWFMQSCRRDGEIQHLVFNERRPAPPRRRRQLVSGVSSPINPRD